MQTNNYDERHDVLHVFLGSQHNSSSDEEEKGIYVTRNDDTDEIVGFTILNFSKNRDKVQRLYPQYNFAT